MFRDPRPIREQIFSRLIIAAILLFTSICVGQDSPPTEPRHFRWSARNAHELEYSKTVKTSKELDSNLRATLVKVLAAQLRPFKADLEIASERELLRAVSKTRIKLIDLDGDGHSEILAQASGFQAGCGATGNCPFWIFEITKEGTKVLFDSRGKDGVGGYQLFTVQPTQTNGFSDIVFADSESGTGRSLYLYRFRDGHYRLSECYNANRLSTKNGEWHELAIPVITRRSCN